MQTLLNSIISICFFCFGFFVPCHFPYSSFPSASFPSSSFPSSSSSSSSFSCCCSFSSFSLSLSSCPSLFSPSSVEKPFSLPEREVMGDSERTLGHVFHRSLAPIEMLLRYRGGNQRREKLHHPHIFLLFFSYPLFFSSFHFSFLLSSSVLSSSLLFCSLLYSSVLM